MAAISIEAYKAKVGEEIGVSEWLSIDQARIDAFADATGDHQFIHVNPEMAKFTPMGGTIAHGFLILSLLGLLRETSDCPTVEGVRMALNYGGNRVRFLTPVRSGSRIRGRFRLVDFAEKGPGRYQETSELTVEIEGQDKPAMIAEWIVQIFL